MRPLLYQVNDDIKVRLGKAPRMGSLANPPVAAARRQLLTPNKKSLA